MLGWVSRLEIFDFGCLDETTRGCPERGVYDVGRPSHHCAGLDSRLLPGFDRRREWLVSKHLLKYS